MFVIFRVVSWIVFDRRAHSSLLRALRPLPKPASNLNWQTMAQLAGKHDNLTTMMAFMSHEIR
jgi:hypothetical protein